MTQTPDISGRDIVLGEDLAPIPERLLLAHARGEVLFIAGAGVSRGAGLPDFRDLVVKVYKYKSLDLAVHSIISKISSSNDNQEDLDLSDLEDNQKAEVERFRKKNTMSSWACLSGGLKEKQTKRVWLGGR